VMYLATVTNSAEPSCSSYTDWMRPLPADKGNVSTQIAQQISKVCLDQVHNTNRTEPSCSSYTE
jgi:hypothetical protein